MNISTGIGSTVIVENPAFGVNNLANGNAKKNTMKLLEGSVTQSLGKAKAPSRVVTLRSPAINEAADGLNETLARDDRDQLTLQISKVQNLFDRLVAYQRDEKINIKTWLIETFNLPGRPVEALTVRLCEERLKYVIKVRCSYTQSLRAKVDKIVAEIGSVGSPLLNIQKFRIQKTEAHSIYVTFTEALNFLSLHFYTMGEAIKYLQNSQSHRGVDSVDVSTKVYSIAMEMLNGKVLEQRRFLGCGHYGRVTLQVIGSHNVAVKRLAPTNSNKQDYIQELALSLLPKQGVQKPIYADIKKLEIMMNAAKCNLRNKMEKPMSYTDLVKITKELRLAVYSINNAGIIHKDIKPENILFNQEDECVLCDFGLAAAKRTNNGGGTLFYQSPEVFAGLEQNEKTDYYALGSTLYELLTGNTFNVSLVLEKNPSLDIGSISRDILKLSVLGLEKTDVFSIVKKLENKPLRALGGHVLPTSYLVFLYKLLDPAMQDRRLLPLRSMRRMDQFSLQDAVSRINGNHLANRSVPVLVEALPQENARNLSCCAPGKCAIM